MSDMLYYVLCAVLTVGVLIGISLMSKVETSVKGNLLSAFCTAGAIFLTLIKYEIITGIDLWICLILSLIVGLIIAKKVKMIDMPQVVALLNGFGGGASAIVSIISMLDGNPMSAFEYTTAGLALAVGMVTLTGSLIAAGKLHNIIGQRPVVWPAHQAITSLSLLATFAFIVLIVLQPVPLMISVLGCTVVSGFFGIAFAIRVGGADMPITISLLNSLSGVAGSIAGMAIGDPLLVAVGGIVGASGLLLTQIMCRAMNRPLNDILMGKTSVAKKAAAAGGAAAVTAANKTASAAAESTAAAAENTSKLEKSPQEVLLQAKNVIIVPGYGMAVAQAQQLVKQLADKLEDNGAEVNFAIHPVAGRMPGHMNILLAEVDVPYEKLHELDDINDKFKDCDVAIVIGANDVVNPAANTAVDTPIYGMPVLNVEKAPNIIICNYDLKPGYAGVNNPLYEQKNASLLLGDASETIAKLLSSLNKTNVETKSTDETQGADVVGLLKRAKKAIIVPGYGMAIAQAQGLVKQLADKLEANGAEVDYAIHPVAGRMPGHMNILLAEADVPYEKLHELDDINDEFKNCDVAIVIGANDVVNPAANTAVDTPIYGMPVLNVEDAPNIIICNYDLNPGYAGVDNPLYESQKANLLLGDAAETISNLLSSFDRGDTDETEQETTSGQDVGELLSTAKKAIIVPGYGMAIAQAQGLVKQLADKLEANGAEVDYAIHPVAGRMPGHMNILLAEADVPYEKLREMDDINGEFASADLAIIIGANDVVNPAANTAVDTPIYGMPILNVEDAKNIIVCNFDLNPGYAGVPNPIYERSNAILMLGNAADTVRELLDSI